MGQSRSKAAAEKDKAANAMNALMRLMETRLQMYLEEFEASLGKEYKNQNIEVGGGRRLRLASDVRVSTRSGVDEGILDAVQTFLTAAEYGMDGEDKKAQKAAIMGVKKTIHCVVDALMGASEGEGMERKGFFDFFLFGAFVRIDYAMYSYTAVGKFWGASDAQAAMVYVAQMSVLDSTELRDDETTFLLSQGLQVPTEKYAKLSKIKDLITIKRIVQKQVKRGTVGFEAMRAMMAELDDCSVRLEQAINDALNDSTGEAEYDAQMAEAS